MKIAFASGKGGTGKTTVATNLAYMASRAGESVAYLDCDVEEPNGHIFLKPEIDDTRPVTIPIPKVDESACDYCGECGEICQYGAIVPLPNKVLVFADMCHGCGGCSLVCHSGAITEVGHKIGKVEVGRSGAINFVHGLLDIGQVMSPPVIKAVQEAAPLTDLVIVDAPPGTSCPVIESVHDSDFVVLVTEPTPFGLNDLKLAVEMIRALELRFGVVINRADVGDDETVLYCRSNHIEILAEIPDDRRIAEVYSRGELVCQALPEYESLFTSVLTGVMRSVM
ncbi:MAG: ATP-binding protein [Phycisphaerales bacterium]|nr:ATP-binding protein [Phycisphaerales bacterium]